VGLFLGLHVVCAVLTLMLDRPEADLLSIWRNLWAVGNALFGIAEGASNLPVVWPVLTLAAVAAACLFVLRSRVRAVEIVT
jgi:hypothetical protein